MEAPGHRFTKGLDGHTEPGKIKRGPGPSACPILRAGLTRHSLL